MKRLLSCLLALCMSICLFSSCSSSEKENKADSASSGVTITENEDGTKIAKTEDGKEIEISSENFMDVYEKYEKVSGSDGESEEELLSEMQIILDSLSDSDAQK